MKKMRLLVEPLFHNYLYDILATIFAILFAIITRYTVTDSNKQFGCQVIILLIFFFIILWARLRDRDLVVSMLQSEVDKHHWLGNGKFEYDRIQQAFVITKSRSGFIHAKCLLWSDYIFEFEFKIVNRCLGVIVRASDLSNYIMLQIRPDCIFPHIKALGGWQIISANDAKLTFDESISGDLWSKCIITCDKDKIRIQIIQKNFQIDRKWDIPVKSEFFNFEEVQKSGDFKKFQFPISHEYGSIGFRNIADEKALVKFVNVQKLDK